MRVVCAMSGGVDSSVAAARLVAAGHEVIGMTMRLYDAREDERRGRGGTCCSPAEIDLARRACGQLGIPHYTVDERARFTAGIIDDFAREYAAGRTPNPCARCNQRVKFGPLLRRARGLGAPLMATGHYARNQDGALFRGRDPEKDQSYFLFAMGRSTLDDVAFPLGDATKDEVRAEAKALGLPNWDAPDSQELCFVPGGDHGVVVQRRLTALGLPTDALAPGPVVDTAGAVIGEHAGIHRVTVGQRRGMKIAGTEKRYVLRVIPQSRTVVVGDRDAIETATITVIEPCWLADPPAAPAATAVQVRHRGAAHPARVIVDGGRVRCTFDPPIGAVAPGQAAVIYDGDRVVGGGWIRDPMARAH